MFHWEEGRGRTSGARGVADANRIDCEVMSNRGGADWGQCASQYAQTNHKQGIAAKSKLTSAFFMRIGFHLELSCLI